MGYYSEVGLVLSKKGVETLHKKMESISDQKTRDYLENLLKDTDKHSIDNVHGEMWYWDGVKWYDDDPDYFPDIAFLTDLMNELDEEDYRFLRLGEEDGDIEDRGNYWDNPFDMQLERRISFG